MDPERRIQEKGWEQPIPAGRLGLHPTKNHDRPGEGCAFSTRQYTIRPYFVLSRLKARSNSHYGPVTPRRVRAPGLHPHKTASGRPGALTRRPDLVYTENCCKARERCASQLPRFVLVRRPSSSSSIYPSFRGRGRRTKDEDESQNAGGGFPSAATQPWGDWASLRHRRGVL